MTLRLENNLNVCFRGAAKRRFLKEKGWLNGKMKQKKKKRLRKGGATATSSKAEAHPCTIKAIERSGTLEENRPGCES